MDDLLSCDFCGPSTRLVPRASTYRPLGWARMTRILFFFFASSNHGFGSATSTQASVAPRRISGHDIERQPRRTCRNGSARIPFLRSARTRCPRELPRIRARLVDVAIAWGRGRGVAQDTHAQSRVRAVMVMRMGIRRAESSRCCGRSAFDRESDEGRGIRQIVLHPLSDRRLCRAIS